MPGPFGLVFHFFDGVAHQQHFDRLAAAGGAQVPQAQVVAQGVWPVSAFVGQQVFDLGLGGRKSGALMPAGIPSLAHARQHSIGSVALCSGGRHLVSVTNRSLEFSLIDTRAFERKADILHPIGLRTYISNQCHKRWQLINVHCSTPCCRNVMPGALRAYPPQIELAQSTEDEKESQLSRLADFHARHAAESPAMLQRLQQAVIANQNVFEVLMEAVRCCSLGQITNALFEVGGQYRRSM